MHILKNRHVSIKPWMNIYLYDYIQVWWIKISLIKLMQVFHLLHKHSETQRFSYNIKVNGAALQWRHNGRDSVSNHQHHHCLLSHLFKRRSKKTSKLRVTGLCAGNSPVTGEFPAQRASNAENIIFCQWLDMACTSTEWGHSRKQKPAKYCGWSRVPKILIIPSINRLLDNDSKIYSGAFPGRILQAIYMVIVSYTQSRGYRVVRNRYARLLFTSEDLRVQEQSTNMSSQCHYPTFAWHYS